jgi:prevent-host-death family protein
MCVITATELKQNLGKYIELSKEEDIIVKKNGKIVTVLTSPSPRDKDVSSFFSLMGKYEYFDYESYLRERDENR